MTQRVGKPVEASVSRHSDGMISFELYDKDGFVVGGSDTYPDGTVVWSLVVKGEVISGIDLPEG